ncbi:MAG: imidazole glycerol phosphate synthase subunit HisF [Oscillospiraceae bacterium]|jgi:cyclase|nr:imidazole glycerol phosphate synthase subunit HisF [Oscillospiraceae bacterium]
MLVRKVIPCLDVKDGKVVKGVNFEGIKEVGDPIEYAEFYNSQGADELVLYDISASIENRIIDLELVRKVSQKISMPFCIAGGIGTEEGFKNALNAGADKVSINSQAVKNPELISLAAAAFGSESVVVGIDAKRGSESNFTVMLGGGKIDTGLDLIEWVKKIQSLGAGEICLNSIDKDGVKNGYDIEMLNAVCETAEIPVIASGGCGKLEHFSEVFSKTKATSALAASVFHFGILTVEEIKEYLQKEGIPVREHR